MSILELGPRPLSLEPIAILSQTAFAFAKDFVRPTSVRRLSGRRSVGPASLRSAVHAGKSASRSLRLASAEVYIVNEFSQTPAPGEAFKPMRPEVRYRALNGPWRRML